MAGRNKTRFRRWIVPTPSVTTHQPHIQLLIFFHEMVSTYL
ncbi:hypothetical protein SIAM614_01114 [Stappia aggregata IAM 12614]|uniref:Uncharacterized protein n=1 Tax=Roseibium aggregatum (strain ATCC 25650 / DSM 13394 / JCM 20685 / NBRC 16684 / NCIMB 2208 / IAM 12614 / B1) TaxID=384765 RepID=A0P0N3_ROSAI|nr:hypothetical protein SIAM614_01114 [Stappia aggregata IAM 12614] [Roseibium aggregatum IAM 12614]